MKSTGNMVWHIFKKDVRLLWPFILGAAGIQFTFAGLRYAMDHVAGMRSLINLYNLLLVATLAVSVLLIATAIHQDAVPGVRQDWLVRPVRRRDLLAAKVFFVLVTVHGPIFLADTMQALANGFSVTQSLGAAASRSLYLLLGLSLPVLAFASLTRNMAEAIIAAVGAFVGFAALQILINNHGQAGPLRGTGVFWIAESSMFTVALLGSSIVLGIQYFRRKTLLARSTMAVVAFLFLLAYLVPWNLGFALEQLLSPNRGAGRSILMAFDPGLSKFRLPEGMNRMMVTASLGAVNGPRDEASTAYLPIQISGLSPGGLLNTDKAELLLRDSDNRVIYRGNADDLSVRKESSAEPVRFTIGLRRSAFYRDVGPDDTAVLTESASSDGSVVGYQGLALPRNVYEHVKDRVLRLEIDYSLTLMRGTTYTMPAVNGDAQIPNVGHCRTRVDDDGDDIQLICIQAGAAETDCSSIFLEHAPSGRRNPVRFYCWPNYAPYFGQYMPDAMTRGRTELPFRDLAGLAKYPVDSSQLPESRVVIRVYRAQDHFKRQVFIPQIRLSDWESIEHAQMAQNR